MTRNARDRTRAGLGKEEVQDATGFQKGNHSSIYSTSTGESAEIQIQYDVMNACEKESENQVAYGTVREEKQRVQERSLRTGYKRPNKRQGTADAGPRDRGWTFLNVYDVSGETVRLNARI